ncbi:hypothetical protein TeGR_g13731 [Tetraparma gracilis]|jgi:hypothetical protein|uniref:DUS-like FMN-binding domain-containing protein n=1 Tax=Tetraparma gracilis TaxID=2962635 RepID=A0ABQ6N1X4_9STRA|nr:hypothetical protein TeGR_g13731 [Tetraparma gracilis]
MPHLKVHLNGGVNSIKEILSAVRDSEEGEGPPIDGVMVGRGIVSQPWYFSSLDRVIYDDGATNGIETRRDLVRAYGVHADLEEAHEGSKRARRRILRPLHTLFNGESHAKRWRQAIDKIMNSAGSKRNGYSKKELSEDEPKLSELLEGALDAMSEEAVGRTREETLEVLLVQDEVAEKARREGKDVVSHDSVAREAIKLWDAERKAMRETEEGEALSPGETEDDILARLKI